MKLGPMKTMRVRMRPGSIRAVRVICVLFAFCFAQLGCQSASAETASDGSADTALAELGRRIFFDTSLSASGKVACATCHDPRYAYGPPPGKAIAIGGAAMNQSGTRAVPSLRYLQAVPAFSERMHFTDGDTGPGGGYMWDGRAASLHEQARLPLLAPNEMANGDAASVVVKVRRAHYAQDFRSVFGRDIFEDEERAFQDVLSALAAFQKTAAEFYPYTSKYDAFLRGEVELDSAEERGVAVFKDPKKGNCASCHIAVARNGTPPLFTDYDYANVGAPRNPVLPANADPSHYDLGLCGPNRTDLMKAKSYCGLFRAPTLRNIALRDAFFHNSIFHTLREAVEFYAERDTHPERWYPTAPDGTVQKANDTPPEMRENLNTEPPFDRRAGETPAMSSGDIDDLIAFLNTLTDGYHVPAHAAP
jgi:cytochrome c peroxidase